MPKTYAPKKVITKYKKLGFRAVIPYHLKELPKGTLSAIRLTQYFGPKSFVNKRFHE